MARAKQLVHAELKVGDIVLHISPATLLESDTVHATIEDAKNYIRKINKRHRQLHWHAEIMQVMDVSGCKCYSDR